MAKAARKLGLADQTLFNWVKARRGGRELVGADSKPVSAQKMEISRLKAELARQDGARHPGKIDGVLRESKTVKYAFIGVHRHALPISVQCRALKVSTAGYHERVARRALHAPSRHLSDEALPVRIRVIHAETHGAYGWPRIWRELLARGLNVGKERVQQSMRRHGTRAKAKRRFRITTDSNHDFPIKPGMPSVANDSRLRNMSVPLMACTTGGVATPRWATAHRLSSSRTGSASKPISNRRRHKSGRLEAENDGHLT